MNRQQIIDAIDAEIKSADDLRVKIDIGSKEAVLTILLNLTYVTGLRFARDLVEKAEVEK